MKSLKDAIEQKGFIISDEVLKSRFFLESPDRLSISHGNGR